MDALTIVILVGAVLLAMAAGLFAGWKAAQKGTEGLRDDNNFLRQAKEAAANDLAAEKQRAARADEYKALLEEVSKERDEANQARAALEADARNFETRIKDVEAMRKDLAVEFSKVGDEMLEKAQKEFLEKAGLKFGELDKETQAKMQALVGPLRELLDKQEKKIAEVEKERVDQYSGLKAVIEEVKQGQGQVRDEARNLVNALRSGPKQRGRWGEKTLENVLQQAGLAEHIDYQTEVSVDTEDGRLRPDAIVNLPGGRKLVIDSKCSLVAYLDAVDEVDDDKRGQHFSNHVAGLKKHVQDLGSKSYWAQFDDAADYVVMFVPGEHFLNAALEKDPNLWDWAFEKKVLLATPTNLVAIARTVASVWKQEKLAAEAGQIASLGRELHARIATMAEHVLSMRTHLERSNGAFNKMVGSLESQVLTQARRFEEFGAGSSKEIPDLAGVESVPRQLTKATPAKSANDADDAA